MFSWLRQPFGYWGLIIALAGCFGNGVLARLRGRSPLEFASRPREDNDVVGITCVVVLQATVALGINFMLRAAFLSNAASTCLWAASLVTLFAVASVLVTLFTRHWEISLVLFKIRPPKLSNVAWNAYMDIARPLTASLEIFVSALALMYMFYKYMSNLDMSTSDFRDEFWIVGLVIQMAMARSNVLGRDFLLEVSFWCVVINEHTVSLKAATSDALETPVPRPNTAETVVRMLMSALVNFSMRRFIVLMTPIMLAQSDDEISFIFNACAMSYITSFDDIADKEFRFFTKDGEILLEHPEEANSNENVDDVELASRG